MAGFSGKFNEGRGDWETPNWLVYAAVNGTVLGNLVQPDLDVAADKDNRKAERFFDKEADGMAQEWSGICWLNPPYGQTGRWIRKAYEMADHDCASTVCLIPARTNTNWWHDCVMRATQILLLRGRVKFGGAEHGLPQPLAIVLFAKNRVGNLPLVGTLDVRGMDERDIWQPPLPKEETIEEEE